MEMNSKMRLIYNEKGVVADLLAYASGLVEGRIAGKYLLSGEKLPDTVVIQGFTRKGILAGADVDIDREASRKEGIDLAFYPRSGRGGPRPVGSVALADLLKSASRKFDAVDVEPDDPAVLLYTSGTTGKPKGVTLTHRNFNAECALVEELDLLREDDRVVLVLPLFHVYALSSGLISGLYLGTTFTLVPQYSPAKLLESIARTNASVLIAVPSMYMHLLQLTKARKTTIPKSLRLCVSGGAPLSLATLREFEEAFHTRIAEGYGLTESASAVCANKSGERFKPGSIGPAPSSVRIKVVDEAGNELPAGEVGEIVLQGALITPGYWNNPEATAEAFHEGWFHTGDLGYADEEGFFFITDRKKDIIVRGGFNISPREIEELLSTHPRIEDAAVVGVRNSRDQEAVKAFVVPRKGETLTERDILSFCAENLAGYKVPKYVEFRENLPKSATGKVLRKELREELRDERLIFRE